MNDTVMQQCGLTQPQEDLPGISVVIIGRNEGPRLVRCLESVLGVDYPRARVELIYVDTDSTDDSCARAEQLGVKVIRIKPERPSAALARNTGLKAATHAFVQFLDGDTILNRDWLKKAIAATADPRVDCVFGRREEIEPRASIYNFWVHHDWYAPSGPSDFCGGDALFRRKVLLDLGGYDGRLIAGEERDLSYRLLRDEGKLILHLDEPMTAHDINMTSFRQYWRRCARSGYAYAEVSALHPGLRAWRRKCQLNLGHALAAAAALFLSGVLWSPWPLLIWAILMGGAVARNALACRNRVGSYRGALLYSCHHYLSKIPATCGHADFYVRRLLGAEPKRLMEYRDVVSQDLNRCHSEE